MCIVNMGTVMSSNNESDQWEFGKTFFQGEAQRDAKAFHWSRDLLLSPANPSSCAVYNKHAEGVNSCIFGVILSQRV